MFYDELHHNHYNRTALCLAETQCINNMQMHNLRCCTTAMFGGSHDVALAFAVINLHVEFVALHTDVYGDYINLWLRQLVR